MELFGKYEVGRLLGCGAFAKVYFARDMRNGQSVAIKVINKKRIAGTSLMSNIKREIMIMRRLHHPNIVRLFEVMATKSKIYFVMELVKGGELFAKVAKGRFSEDLTRNYFHQLISAISYCHSRGVYHRDLKPENLLVDEDGNLKVSDFGLSALRLDDAPDDSNTNINHVLLQTLCGTPAYVAPEILAKKGYDGAKVDIWSCGVLLFVLTAGYLPFNDPNLMAMYKKIYKGEYKCPKWMSTPLKRFLSRLLDINPKTRITLDQIIRDPWFTKDNAPNLPHFTFTGDSTSSYATTSSDDDNDDNDDTLSCSQASETSHELLNSVSSSSSLNAFDLISFSSGLDLSGLFNDSFNQVVHAQRFLSAETPDKIVEQIQEAATADNVKLRRKKNKNDYSVCVVDLQGPNANFVANLEISSLTENLLVAEVKKTAGDSAAFTLFWNNRITPLLSSLSYHPEPETPTAPPSAPLPDAGLV